MLEITSGQGISQVMYSTYHVVSKVKGKIHVILNIFKIRY